MAHAHRLKVQVDIADAAAGTFKADKDTQQHCAGCVLHGIHAVDLALANGHMFLRKVRNVLGEGEARFQLEHIDAGVIRSGLIRCFQILDLMLIGGVFQPRKEHLIHQLQLVVGDKALALQVLDGLKVALALHRHGHFFDLVGREVNKNTKLFCRAAKDISLPEVAAGNGYLVLHRISKAIAASRFKSIHCCIILLGVIRCIFAFNLISRIIQALTNDEIC